MYSIPQSWCHVVSRDGCSQVWGSVLRSLWWGKLGPKSRVIFLPLFSHASMVFLWSSQPPQKKGWISSAPNTDDLISRSRTCSFSKTCFLPVLHPLFVPCRVYALYMIFIVPCLCNHITKVSFASCSYILPLHVQLAVSKCSDIVAGYVTSIITKCTISQIVIVLMFSHFSMLMLSFQASKYQICPPQSVLTLWVQQASALSARLFKQQKFLLHKLHRYLKFIYVS